MTAVTIEAIGDKRVKVVVHNDTTIDVMIDERHIEPRDVGHSSFSFLNQPTSKPRTRRPRRTDLLTLEPGAVIERIYDLDDYFAYPSGPCFMYVPVRHCNPERYWWATSNTITL